MLCMGKRVKKIKSKKVKKELTTLEKEKSNLSKPSFVLVSEYQKAFDGLKITLTTALVLGYPDFTR